MEVLNLFKNCPALKTVDFTNFTPDFELENVLEMFTGSSEVVVNCSDDNVAYYETLGYDDDDCIAWFIAPHSFYTEASTSSVTTSSLYGVPNFSLSTAFKAALDVGSRFKNCEGTYCPCPPHEGRQFAIMNLFRYTTASTIRCTDWDTDLCCYAEYLAYNNQNLVTLDLSGIKYQNALFPYGIGYLFRYSLNIKEITLKGWSTDLINQYWFSNGGGGEGDNLHHCILYLDDADACDTIVSKLSSNTMIHSLFCAYDDTDEQFAQGRILISSVYYNSLMLNYETMESVKSGETTHLYIPDTIENTRTAEMFNGITIPKQLYFHNMGKVVNSYSMFAWATLPEYFDCSPLYGAWEGFENCQNFNTMFYGVAGLKALNLDGALHNATSMGSMIRANSSNSSSTSINDELKVLSIRNNGYITASSDGMLGACWIDDAYLWNLEETSSSSNSLIVDTDYTFISTINWYSNGFWSESQNNYHTPIFIGNTYRTEYSARGVDIRDQDLYATIVRQIELNGVSFGESPIPTQLDVDPSA